MNIFNRFIQTKKGIAAIEFALIAPLFCILLTGVVEVSNFVYADIKAKNAAGTMVNLLNQQEQLTSPDIEQLTKIVPKILSPIALTNTDYRVIITSMQQDKPGLDPNNPSQMLVNFPYVFWQEAYGEPSIISPKYTYIKGGDEKANAIAKDAVEGFEFKDSDQIIYVEIGIKYNPLLTGGYAPQSLSVIKHAFFGRPRKGAYALRPDELE